MTTFGEKKIELMLKWNFKRVCKIRGIIKPYSYFKKLGITHTLASHMATDKIDKIGLRHLDMLCMALNCTPNDLLDWEATTKKIDKPDTALYALKKDNKDVTAAEELSRLPTARLAEIARILREG